MVEMRFRAEEIPWRVENFLFAVDIASEGCIISSEAMSNPKYDNISWERR